MLYNYFMRILLTNYSLGGNSGSETWTTALGSTLTKIGHDVIYKTHNDFLEETPDIAIINHNVCLNKFRDLPCKKIFTSHGILPDLEQPVMGADVYVSVSEEVQARLKSKGFESIVIRNGIDCNVFNNRKPVNEKLTNVLFSSNYDSNSRKIIKQACVTLGINFRHIGGMNSIKDVPTAINEADLVIGLGRTAYEAMACERNVIIFDYNGGDGIATPETLLDFRKNNCSGRYNKFNYTSDDIVSLLLQYDPKRGALLRKYILDNNNIEKVADMYLNL